MSNHRTALWGFLLILKYSNGVKTLVPIIEWSKDYALEEINKAIKIGKTENWEKVLNLLIESCQKDIYMIKAIIYEQLENGKLFEEVDE